MCLDHLGHLSPRCLRLSADGRAPSLLDLVLDLEPGGSERVESSTRPVVPAADHQAPFSRKWAELTTAQATRQAIRDSYVEDVAGGGIRW